MSELSNKKVKITIPIIFGIVAVIIAILAIGGTTNLSWIMAGFDSMIGVALYSTISFIFGWFIGALTEESYWFVHGESKLTTSQLLWGWSGIVVAAIVTTSQNTMTSKILSFAFVTTLIWGGPMFTSILLKARNSFKQESTEQ